MSSEYIYTQNASKVSNLSHKILNWIYDKQTSLGKTFNTAGIHPEAFITLDDLANLVGSTDSLTEGEKKDKAIDDSLYELQDIKNDKREIILYLYPTFQIIESKIKCKIALISPNSNLQVQKDPYRRAFFDSNKKILDKIFDTVIVNLYGLKSDGYLPGKRFIKKDQSGNLKIYPNLPTLERYFADQVKRAFLSYTPYEIPDFIEDVIKFAKNNRESFEIIPGYTLPNNPSGTDIELHYKEYFYGLELFIKHKSKLCKDKEAQDNLDSYINLYEKVSNPNDLPKDERKSKLYDVVNNYLSLSEFQDDINDCNTMMRIIDSLNSKVQEKIKKDEEEWVENQYLEFEKTISNYSNSNQILFYFNLNEYVEKVKGKAKEELVKELSEKIKKNIHVKFSSHKLTEDIDNLQTYSVDPGYFIKVLYNLKVLSLSDPKFSEQHEIAKRMYFHLENIGSLTLNSKMDREESTELRRKYDELDQGKKPAPKPSSQFNYNAALFGGTSVVMIAGVAFIVTSQFEYIFAGIGAGMISAFVTGFIFRIKPQEKNVELKGPKTQKVSTLLKVAEEIIYKSGSPISEQLRTKDTIEKIALKNIAHIRKMHEPFAKEKDDEKIVNSVYKIIASNSAVLKVPKDLILKGKPDTYYIRKSDFKSKAFRQNVVKYFQDELHLKKSKEAEKYYGFLIHALEIDYAKFLK
jgi:hypothetical protein